MQGKYGFMIIFVLVLSITVIYATHICGLCPAGFFYKGCLNNSSPVCEKCPEGTFKAGLNGLRHCTKCKHCVSRNTIVVSKCNATHDTECRCRDGYYFDKVISQCSRCSKCIGKNNVVVKKCHGNHNTECRCKDGYYFDTGALYCSRCSRCKKGQGVVKNCTSRANTQCARCVKGLTFSPTKSRTESCRPCRICGPYEEVDKECSRKRNRICKILPQNKLKTYRLQNKSKWPEPVTNKTTKGPKTTSSSTEPLKTTLAGIDGPTSSIVGAKKIKSEYSSSSDLSTVELVLIITGAVLALLTLVVVSFIIFRWRRNQTNTAHSPPITTVVKTAPPAYPHHVKPREAEINRLSQTPLMTGSTELLRNANFSLIEELSTYLNPNRRWKSLAGKLGYKSKDIENFDIEPAEATEKMLTDWSHQKGSTVHRLYEVFVAMKWGHEADIVYKYINSP